MQFKDTFLTDDLEQNIKFIGKYFTQLGCLSINDFKQFLTQVYHTNITYMIAHASKLQKQRSNAPTYFMNDLNRYIEQLEKALINDNAYTPIDLEGTKTERLTQFQKIVKQYGLLLENWSDIIQATVELKKKGYLVSNFN